MKGMKKLTQWVKSRPSVIEDTINYNTRCNFGLIDLKKSLPNGVPISREQSQRIDEFWRKYTSSFKYGHSFDKRWFDVYNRTNVFGFPLEYYIPDGYYYAIVDKSLTNAHKSMLMDDKNLYDLYFHDVNQPKTICRRINGVFMDRSYHVISREEAIKLCVANSSVIIKPSVFAMGGDGIEFWRDDEDSMDKLRSALESKDNLIVQELIKQHRFLSDFSKSCVNTMRIVTLLWEDEVHVTSSVLILGGPSSKTNHLHGGGIVCGILPSGRLREVGFDGKLNEYKSHPSGPSFCDLEVPNYDKCVNLVKSLAPRLSAVAKLLNWDITLDENCEPLLIEVNLTFGGSVQIAAGPALGDKTVEVLDYVASHGAWR